MLIKKLLFHSFSLIFIYYLMFFLCIWGAISGVGFFYNASSPLLSNLLSASFVLLSFIIAAITMSLAYIYTTRKPLNLRATLKLASFSLIIPCSFVFYFFGLWLFGFSIFLDKIAISVLLLVSFLIFFSQLLFAPSISWLCFKIGLVNH